MLSKRISTRSLRKNKVIARPSASLLHASHMSTIQSFSSLTFSDLFTLHPFCFSLYRLIFNFACDGAAITGWELASVVMSMAFASCLVDNPRLRFVASKCVASPCLFSTLRACPVAALLRLTKMSAGSAQSGVPCVICHIKALIYMV